MTLKEAVEHAEAERTVQVHKVVAIDAEAFDLIIAAAKTQVRTPTYQPVWEVRCIEYTGGNGTCPGYIPHIAVRTQESDAIALADSWKNRDNRACVEIRKSEHIISN